MASPDIKLLTDIELSTVKSLVLPLLPTSGYSNLRSTFSGLLDSKRRIYDAYTALTAAQKNTITPVSSKDKLGLISALDDFSAGNIEIGALYWNDPSVNSLTEVARRFTQTLGKDLFNLTYFQTRIWVDQPSAVYWSLFNNNIIVVSGGDTLRRDLVDTCAIAIAQGHKIGVTAISEITTTNSAYSTPRQQSGQAWQTYLENLWRLNLLAKVPQDVAYLLNSSYSSASLIANAQRSTFINTMTSLGMGEGNASSVYDYSIFVELRNEQAWSAMLASRSNWTPAAIASSTPTSNPRATPAAAPYYVKQIISYSNLFGDTNITAYDDCSSVTGPAAYLVDLFRLLKNALSDPATPNSPSVLTKLFDRRPDLRKMELSCANVNTALPYIDLVNEILEMAVNDLGNQRVVGTLAGQSPAYNCSDQDVTEKLLSQPQNTLIETYRRYIARQAYPPTVFPYIQAYDFVRTQLQGLGSSKYELTAVFGSKYRLPPDGGYVFALDKYKLSQRVIDYALAAEKLNLQPEDFLSITSNAFATHSFIQKTWLPDMTQTTYRAVQGLMTTQQLWGYSVQKMGQSQNALMTGETEGLGLVIDQLLPRAAISFQELIDVMKSRFINGKLALENNGNTPLWNGDPADLRLRRPLSGDGANSMATLQTQDCHALQAFLRLWRKSGMSLRDLDIALNSFTDKSNLATTIYGDINPETIASLAGVRELVELTDLSVENIMTFYGLIDTWGDDCLFVKLFLNGRVSTSGSPFSRNETTKKYLTDETATISNNKSVILAALSIDEKHWASILRAANINNDILNLSNISAIYRISMFCKMMAITPFQYGAFVSLFGPGFSPFSQPETTLRVVKSWRASLSFGLSTEEILHITKRGATWNLPDSSYGIPSQQLVKVLMDMLRGLTALDRTILIGDAITTTTATVAEVAKITTMMFDPLTAGKVRDFIEAPTGAQSPIYRDVLLQYFKPNQVAAENLLFNTFTPTGGSPDTVIALESLAAQRRVLLLQVIGPALRLRLANEVVLEATKPLLPEIDSAIIEYLISDLIRFGAPAKSALEILGNSVATNITALRGESIRAYFVPPSTDLHRFCVPLVPREPPPVMTLDGKALSFSTSSNMGWFSDEVNLTGGQAYVLVRESGNLSNSTYSTIRTAALPLDSEVIIDQKLVAVANELLLSALRAGAFLSRFKLDLTEIKLLQSLPSTNVSVLDLNNISYKSIEMIQQYVRVRERTVSSEFSIVDFLKWITSPGRDYEGLAPKLSALTKVPLLHVQDFIMYKYPDIEWMDKLIIFEDIREVRGLLDAWDLLTKLKLPGLTFLLLLKLGTPMARTRAAISDGNSGEWEWAAELKALTTCLQNTGEGNRLTKANNILRENQRKVLTSYLLTTDFMRLRRILDEGGLFDYFLIDAQMGPLLQTSRLKQAISSVQVFIQRCILGLEKQFGSSSGTINIDRWNWMQKYRVWEASRKVFLYPENYLEPTLRDNKSDAFKALEDIVLQTELNKDTVHDLIKNYVYLASDVADLDVQAYLWEKVSTYAGTFHLFARTRSAPYKYHYRTVEITQDQPPKALWQPWTKIDIEVPAIEADGNGSNLSTPGAYIVPALFGRRLFLFLPQLILKQVDVSSTSTKTFSQMSNDTTKLTLPSKYWQIQMGWTEYRNGTWTAKQVSPAVLMAGGAQTTDAAMSGRATPAAAIWTAAQRFPSDPGSFKFTTNTRTASSDSTESILIIDTEWSFGPISDVYYTYPVGRFELRGNKLVLGDSNLTSMLQRAPFTATVPTSFGKQLYRPSDTSPSPSYQATVRGVAAVPTYGIVSGSGTRTSKWTLSFDENRHAGWLALVQDVSTIDLTTSYFTYPLWPNATAAAATEYLQNSMMPKLMDASTMTKTTEPLFKLLNLVPWALQNTTFGKQRAGGWHELSSPSSLYTWELSVHLIMLMMEKLQSTGQFDLALTVARYLFDPTADGFNLDRCWVFPPFKELAATKIDNAEDILKKLSATSGGESSMDTSVLEWRKNPFVPAAIARNRPTTYMKRIVMKYIEVLIASGDDYFRQNTLESIAYALQRYIEASQVYGSAPKQIPKLARNKPASYADLESTLNDFSNSQFDMELDYPFYCDPSKRGFVALPGAGYPLTGILKTTYFSVPTNPRLLELGALINDRLFKIRNSQDIAGNFRTLSLFEPPLDPGMLVAAVAKGVNLTSLLSDTVGPMPNFRFAALLDRALGMCGELKAMGAAFLVAKESKDSEALAALQSKQEQVMQNVMIDMKQLAISEIEKSIEELQETRKGHVTRLKYYLALSGDDDKAVPGEKQDWDDIEQSIEKPSTDEVRMNSNEKLEMTKASSATTLNSKAASLDIMAALIRAIPDITVNVEPLGVGTTMGAVTVNVSDAMAMGAGVMRSYAQMDADDGARAARKAEIMYQLQDRRQEANSAGREIKVTDKQIETLQIRLAICKEEMKQQRLMVENVAATNDFLRSKYTSEQLYGWMDGQLRTLFYQTYLVTNELAKKAQKVYKFERSDDPIDYLGQSYWDSSRDGLLSGENLFLSLKRMEAAYLDKRGHDFEITKTISLRQIQPLALFMLREAGVAEFSLPETLFDLDFPGQYLRRIKTLNVSVSCATDVGNNFNMTLTLLEHRYRVSVAPCAAADYPQKSTGDDDRFRTDRVPISSIAVSQVSGDSGVFDYELEFNDYQRYVPFEGSGCLSKWRLELPTHLKQFDYSAINDVTIQLKYTANSSSAEFRRVAGDTTKTLMNSVTGLAATDGLFAVVDLKNDYPTQWALLTSATRSTSITGLANRLPYFTKGRTVRVETITAFIKATSSIAWQTNLTLAGNANVSFTAAPDVGTSKVIRAAGLGERFTDWSLTITAAGLAASLQNVVFVVRYYLA